ncbi:MAG: CHASE2 domain-containing protein [Opitutales bacterium]
MNRLFYLLMLMPVPLLWVGLALTGSLDRLENIVMDWRFQVRGELESPANIIYADLDEKAMAMDIVGERPWDRRFFADVGTLLIELGGARVVGYDFVFSSKSMSKMVPPEVRLSSDQKIANLVQRFPDKVVLAANYTQLRLPFMDEPSIPPLVYQDDSFLTEDVLPYPEGPTYPIISYQEGRDMGRLGIIFTDDQRAKGAKPRWCPLWFPYRGEDHRENILGGMRDAFRIQGLPTELVKKEETIELQVDGEPFETMPRWDDFNFHHLSLEMLLAYHGLTGSHVQISEERLTATDETGEQVLNAPLTDRQLVEVNWFSRWDSPVNPRVSIHDLFFQYQQLEQGTPKEQEEAEAFFARFQDALVLIGPVDRILQDLAPTPFDNVPVPKVGVHGNMLKTLISGRFIERLPMAVTIVAILLLSLVTTSLFLYSGKASGFAKAAALVVLGGYIGVGFALFSAYDLVVPLAAPAGAALSTAFIGLGVKLVSEERQKGRIKGMFGTYVSPELVDQMVESGEEPSLGGVEADITALFSDIQSFSSFSEKLPPGDLVELMNEYLTAMTDILQRENGTLDKYIGDAIVAMFGAPIPLEDHALRGCRATVAMQKKQAELRRKWEAEGDRWPGIVQRMETRIGLNSGPATVGNMGSQTRFNYTMMGDTVNLAARSESGAKSYGVYSMVSGETKAACEARSDAIVFRQLDRIIVKGRSQPVSMYEVIDLKDNISEDDRLCMKYYAEGMELYFRQQWEPAIECFRTAEKKERHRPELNRWYQTNPSIILIARCQYMQLHPPGEDWDGVYTMKSK